jgi:hypothetical protein
MIYYVALPFVRVDGGLAPGEAAECPHAASAIRRAQAMSSDDRSRSRGREVPSWGSSKKRRS